ncbi:MAG TPA: FAD-dependent oxidoreductase [Streptosporangiaceae bacterium]
MTAERLVVVGGGPAALEAVRAYREAGAGGDVVLVSADEYLPYNRPPLSKDFLRGESEEDALPLEDGSFYRHHDIEVRLGTRAQALDTGRRVVTLGDGETLSYGWCILATGAYGGNPGLREWLEKQEIPYVLAVACNAMIPTAAGPKRADELAELVPAGAWQRLSCADGSKGPRLYDWALVASDSSDHWLLVRRSLQPGEKGGLELAFYRCWSPRPVTLAELAAVAGARWGVEDCFAEAKNEAGLDHYQVRRFRAWYRHITLAMLAHAFLAVTARATRPAAPQPPQSGAACGNAGSEPVKKGI